jgi:type I restriction enzyme S subunit
MTDTWDMTRLADMADIRVSNVDKKSDLAEIPVRLCNYMDVYLNTYVTRHLDFMDATATPSEIERFTLRRGDVVITKDSETPDDIGIPAVIAEDIERLICGYHLALIRPDPARLDSIYLTKQLATARVARFFAQKATGSTRYGLPTSAIETLTIPTPPLPEQIRIAEVLSTVDRAIEQREVNIAKLRLLRAGLMQDLLSGRQSIAPLLDAARRDVTDLA